jgi:TusA-related sulfurtransferase
MNRIVLGLALLLLGSPLFAQETKPADSMKDCPMHAQHMAQQSHRATMESHGDQAMGFPHDKTTHHFRLVSNGGTIEVTANDPNDKANTEAIRSHLSHIVMTFGEGDFSAPMFTHDTVPPGVTTMKLMKSAIHYAYEELPSGGRVRIQSADPIAVASIHDFLRFQITEHQTGDSVEVAQK